MAALLGLGAASCDRDHAPTQGAPPLVRSSSDAGVGAGAAQVPEVVVAKEKTSAGGVVIAVGAPRMQVTRNLSLEQAVRVGAKRAFAVDQSEVKVWELDAGRLVARYAVPWDQNADVSLAVSLDGAWLATGRRGEAFAIRAPFATAEFPVRFWPHQFSADGSTLVGAQGGKLAELQVARGAESTELSPAPSTAANTLDASRQGPARYLIRDADALRWNRAANAFEVVAKASRTWTSAKIAERAPIAVVGSEDGLQRLDLASGALTPITAGPAPLFAVSPSGERVVTSSIDQLQVLETRTGKQLFRAIVKGVQRIAYSDDENVIAYVEEQRFVIRDLVKGPRSFPEPARFRDWLTRDTALVARGRNTERLTVASQELAPIATPALPARPPGAPAWATWVTPAPDGSLIAAEPVARSGVDPRRRAAEAWCSDQLRVWTPKAGERTLTYKSVSAWDPCWQIAGGLVVGASVARITVHDPQTGKLVAALDVGEPPEPTTDDALAHEYFAAAVSPTGKHLALWWRRADVWAPEPAIDTQSHGDAGRSHTPTCKLDLNHECTREYYMELWSLAGRPRRLWQERLDSKHATARTWPLSKLASGPISFTHDGKHVLFGFDDGDIVIRAVGSDKPRRVESLHHAAITRIEVSPGDAYVFTEDAEGEQRIWPFSPP